ncbi:MAG TPA: hypothetical protein VGB91_09585 [Rhizomicrobium sp.]
MAGVLATVTPLTAARKKLAYGFLGQSQSFSALRAHDTADGHDEPIDYDTTHRLDSDINNYYRFHIDYTPYFERRWNLFRPAGWLYYIDINDEVIEQKFPLDQDIRGIITAFRYSIVRNRRRIIALKRMVQIVGSAALLLPAILLALQPAYARDPMVLAGLILGALIVTVAAGFYQYLRDSQLQSVLESNGRTLANQIQTRANDLNRHFLEFFARIDREGSNDNLADPEWTHRSAWWMKLCMWYPRRIEGIETFLQSEMQRTRIYMLRSAWIGYGSAFLVLVGMPLAAAIFITLVQPAAAGLSLPWLFLIGGAIGAALLTLYSIRTSIGLTDIAEAIGKDPLGHGSRFADLDLHNKLAGQIRRDKELLRQSNLRGGYGENRNRG